MDLPLSDRSNQLLVIIDHFAKVRHFISFKKNEKRAENLALVFLLEKWRLYGIPWDIVLAWNSQFTSKFWNVFLTAIGMKPRISTAFHSESEGHTERLNQIIEAFLREVVNLEMSD
jgi:hypothetical protein